MADETFEVENGYYLKSKDKFIEDEEASRIFAKLMDLHPECNEAFSYDDIGTATLMNSVFGEELKYCPQHNMWYHWNGKNWAAENDSAIVSDKLQTLLNLLVKYCDEAEFLNPKLDLGVYRKYIMSIRRFNAMKNVLKLAETHMRISAMDFDNNPYILNTPKQAYDLKDMRTVVDREKLDLTQITKCNLEPEADKCERWYTFINEIMCGNKKQAAFLQRALGYSILGVNREECMFVALGSRTRNGKGTLFSSIMNVLGREYAQAAAPMLICEARNGKQTDFNAPQPALRKLVNARLVNLSESPKDVKLDSTAVKVLTGRDLITARGLYEGSFDFVPQFTMWLNTNYLPAITDDTVFKSNRIWVIKFDAYFDEDTRDLDLKEFFAKPENQPTILQWLVDGCQDYLLHGLNPPDCVRENTLEYESRFDRVGTFLAENTTRDVTGTSKIPRSELYGSYRSWCAQAENRFSPISSSNFYGELSNRGYEMRRHNDGWYVFGIKSEKPKKGIINLV